MTILALADTHISDTRRIGGAAPMENGRPLVLAQAERALAWVAEMALDYDAELIIHAGDLYDAPRPSPAAESVAVEALINLTEIAPVVVLVGNHDRPTGGGAHALEPLKHLAPGRLHIADTPDPVSIDGGRITVGIKKDAEYVVWPLPYPQKAGAQDAADTAEAGNALISTGLEIILTEHAREARALAAEMGDESPTRIIAAHVTLRGARFNAYQVAPLSDVQVPVAGLWDAFDEQFAGHLHQRQDAPGSSLPGYVGALDRMDFGEERETPGVAIHDALGARHYAYPGARRFLTIDLDTSAGRNLVDDIMVSGIGYAEEADISDDRQAIHRFVGELAPEEHAALSSCCRSWRARGWIVSNQTHARSETRARIEIQPGESLDAAALIQRALDARPEHAARASSIAATLAEMLG